MYDLIVIGAGHAGCEAALAAARMGVSTLLLTLDMNSVALMPCNPAIGGTGKGHLVRELDALGGQMGLCIDRTFLQSRMLNRGKGPAVHSLRAQADKRRYHEDMMATLFSTDHLTIRQGNTLFLCKSLYSLPCNLCLIEQSVHIRTINIRICSCPDHRLVFRQSLACLFFRQCLSHMNFVAPESLSGHPL